MGYDREEFLLAVHTAFLAQFNSSRALVLAANKVLGGKIPERATRGLACAKERRRQSCGLLVTGQMLLGDLFADAPGILPTLIDEFSRKLSQRFGGIECAALTSEFHWGSGSHKSHCHQYVMETAGLLFDIIRAHADHHRAM